MIADVVDTLITLSWALLAWIVLCAVFATLALYAVVTIVWAAGRAIWLVLSAACAAVAARRALSARLPAGQSFRDRLPPEPAERRTEPQQRPAPHWAHTDTEEAA